MTDAPRDLIGSVDLAMRVLLMFQTRDSVRVTDVADECGIARSSAHRLLSTLAWRGFVSQDQVSRVYRAGGALMEFGLGSMTALDIRRATHRHLQRVAAITHETANLFVLEGSSGRIIDGVESDRAKHTRLHTGQVLPAYATAGGKVLIADLARADVKALYPSTLRPVTKKTISTFGALIKQLSVVKGRGYALNINESVTGLGAVAVPIRDNHGRAIASLAVSVPVDRMTSTHVEGLLKVLTPASSLIGADLL